MTKLSEIKTDKRILVIGQSGTGKTRLCGTLAEVLPTLIVTADASGLDTLKSMGVDANVILIEDWTKVWEYFTEIAKASQDYRAIALDDFGSLQEAGMDKIELSPRTYAEDKMSKRDLELQIRQQLLLGERKLQIQQWGDLSVAMNSFLAEVNNLPFAVKLVTCLEGIAKNPRTGEEHIYPSILGSMRTIMSAKFSLVASAFITNLDGANYYCLSCRSHARTEAKNRYGEGFTLVSPTMAKLLARINGKETESKLEQRIGTGL